MAGDLYALAPDEFVAARNQRAKEIAAAGDRSLAGAVKKLPKPSLVAWLANTLVRTEGPAVAELVELGPRLRAAHVRGTRAEMRTLTDRRRRIVGNLVDGAAGAARSAGYVLGPQSRRQLEETLEAAVAEEAAATALLAGRLHAPMRFVGFAGSSATTAEAGPGSPTGEAGTGAGRAGASRRAISEAQRALDRADHALAQARRGAAEAEEAAEEAKRRHDTAAARLRTAAAEMRRTERDTAASKTALDTARRSLGAARRRLRQAEGEQAARAAELASTPERDVGTTGGSKRRCR